LGKKAFEGTNNITTKEEEEAQECFQLVNDSISTFAQHYWFLFSPTSDLTRFGANVRGEQSCPATCTSPGVKHLPWNPATTLLTAKCDCDLNIDSLFNPTYVLLP